MANETENDILDESENLFKGSSEENQEQQQEENQEQHQEEEQQEQQQEQQEENQEEQQQENQEQEEEVPLIQELINNVGLTFKGDNNTEKEYPDSPEGLVSYIQDVIKHTEDETLKKAETNYFESIPPIVKDFYNHVASGNEVDAFFNNPLKNIQNLVLDENNSDLCKTVIKTRMELGGLGDKADMYIRTLEASGELFKTAEEDLVQLRKIDTNNKVAQQEKIKQDTIRQEQEQQQFVSNVNNIILKGDLGNINIPVTEREKFKDYLFKPVKDGKSQHVIDLETNSNVEQELAMAYFFNFKKGNLGTIVSKKVGEERQQSLRKRFGNNSQNSHNANTKNTSTLDFSDNAQTK